MHREEADKAMTRARVRCWSSLRKVLPLFAPPQERETEGQKGGEEREMNPNSARSLWSSRYTGREHETSEGKIKKKKEIRGTNHKQRGPLFLSFSLDNFVFPISFTKHVEPVHLPLTRFEPRLTDRTGGQIGEFPVFFFPSFSLRKTLEESERGGETLGKQRLAQPEERTIFFILFFRFFPLFHISSPLPPSSRF